MKDLIRLMSALCLFVGGALAATPPSKGPAPMPNPTGSAAAGAAGQKDPVVDSALDGLYQIGTTLKEFSGNLKSTETDENLGTDTVRLGRVWYQKKSDDRTRIRVTFDQRIANNLKRNETIEYLLDGMWLIDRDYRTRNETKRQVLKPGQKMDLFKLGEGPFPMPIGQKKQDVYRQFDVKGVAPTGKDPAGTVHLQLTPKKETDLARRFHSIDVWADQKTHMPRRIDTLDRDQNIGRSIELTDLRVNPDKGLSDADFQLPNIDKSDPPWNRHTEALAD